MYWDSWQFKIFKTYIYQILFCVKKNAQNYIVDSGEIWKTLFSFQALHELFAAQKESVSIPSEINTINLFFRSSSKTL